MFDSLILLSYFCFIIVLQSTIGVGILVLGTPFLLILDLNILNIFFILLPVSIVTSLINLLIMKNLNQTAQKITLKEFKKFLVICVPSIFIGLIILKYFQDLINFKFLVSVVIIFSIALVAFKDKIKYRINFFRISILSVVGIIHGLTNSGGTLLSLSLSVDKKKNYARFNITLFYLILATFQYLITVFIFYKEFYFPMEINLAWVILLGILFGNIIYKYIDNKIYKVTVNLLAVFSALILINS